MGNYKNLAVWQKAHQLALSSYRVTASFPKEELYGLVSQIRCSAASIPANIAEGSGRGGDTELARFLRIAAGSAHELEYHLLLASELEFLERAQYQHLEQQVIEVKRMLSGLIQSLSRNKT